MERYLTPQVRKDLKKKMVFIGGPRQVGKTTLATEVQPRSTLAYLNWDIPEHRDSILKRELPNRPLLVLDEIHKFRKWRNYLKGLFDAIKAGVAPEQQILVTGSARLDFYRFGGDSLQGRYHYLRLLPLTLGELKAGANAELLDLYRLGGFPEPFFSQSEVEAKRWSREYRTRLVREDLRDLESIQDIGSFELLTARLPQCVGSPLSINSLSEDLQVAHRTLTKWIVILERLYGLFRIPPFQGPRIRAVKKEQKAYLYDWTQIENEGARFENMVAVHLLKLACWQEDCEGRNSELRYFRDSDGREVDFILMENSKPTLFVECKLTAGETSPHLRYLCERFAKVPAYQIHLHGNKDFQTPEGIRIMPAHKLLHEWV